jgi:hypothetical protein
MSRPPQTGRPAAARAVPACFAAAALLACLLPGAALATDFRFAPDERRIVEIDGERSADARVFASSDGGRALVDLPSEKRVVFIDPTAGTAAVVPAPDVARHPDGSIRVNDRFAWSATWYAFSIEGTVWTFQTELSNVVVTLRTTGEGKSAAATDASGAAAEAVAAPATTVPSAPDAPRPTPASGGHVGAAAAPAAPAGPPAAECVSLVARPASGVPGCTQAVFLRNACEVPVLATLQRTEHLMTGPLPQIFSQAVLPGEQWLGCAWWSGAMAPAQHAIVGAAFLDGPPGRHGRGGRAPGS